MKLFDEDQTDDRFRGTTDSSKHKSSVLTANTDLSVFGGGLDESKEIDSPQVKPEQKQIKHTAEQSNIQRQHLTKESSLKLGSPFEPAQEKEEKPKVAQASTVEKKCVNQTVKQQTSTQSETKKREPKNTESYQQNPKEEDDTTQSFSLGIVSSILGVVSKLFYNHSYRKLCKEFTHGTLITTKDYQFLENKKGEIMLYRYTGISSKVTLPSYVEGKPVVYLHSDFLHSSTLPFLDYRVRGVQQMIKGNVALTPDNLKLQWQGIQTMTLPSTLQCIHAYTFVGCKSIKLLVIPKSVKFIDASAFANSSFDSIIFLGECPKNLHLAELPANCKIYCTKKKRASFADFIKNYRNRG